MRRLIGLSIFALVVALLVAPAAVAAEPGDEPATAIAVAAGTSRFDSSAMTESGADPGPCREFTGDLSATMWLRYEPSKSGITIIDVNSFVSDDGTTDFLAIVYVYRDDAGTLTEIGCSAYPAAVELAAEGGASYLIAVAGLAAQDTGEPELSDKGGTFDVSITTIKGRVQHERFRGADTFVDEEFCSVPVTIAFDDKAVFAWFYGPTGLRASAAHWNGWTSVSVDGGSTLKVVYNQQAFDNPDGTVVVTGLAQDLILDGKRIARDVGRLVFDGETGEVLFDSGRHEQFIEGVDFCALLGV